MTSSTRFAGTTWLKASTARIQQPLWLARGRCKGHRTSCRGGVRPIDSSSISLPSNGASTDSLVHDNLSFSDASGRYCSSNTPDNWQKDLPYSTTLLPEHVLLEKPTFYCGLRPEVDAPVYLNNSQVQYVLRALRVCVPSMAYTGSALFLHQNLWQRYQPESYQDCVSLSALYLCKTSGNTSLITNSINSKVLKLKGASSNWGF